MVSSYSYCMTTSSLVQRLNSTPSPHLKTIQPHHLASLLHVGGVSGVAGVVGRLGDAVERLLEVLEEVWGGGLVCCVDDVDVLHVDVCVCVC